MKVYGSINSVYHNNVNSNNFGINPSFDRLSDKNNKKSAIYCASQAVAAVVGTDAAIFLSRIQYWEDKCGHIIKGFSGKWIYNTLEQWAEQFGWSTSKVYRITKKLEEHGLLITRKMNSYRGNTTKWYSTVRDAILDICKPFNSFSKVKNRFSKVKNAIYKHKNTNIRISSSNEYTYREEIDGELEKREEFLNKEDESSIRACGEAENKKVNTECIANELAQQEGLCRDNTVAGQKERIAVISSPETLERKIINHTTTTKEQPRTILKTPSEAKREASLQVEVAQEMVEVWKDVFKHAVHPIKAYVTKGNIFTLNAVLKEHFASNMELWREYAIKVNSSKFLMGEKTSFKATFEWLLKPKTINTVLGEGYGVGDRVLDMHNITKTTKERTALSVKEAERQGLELLKGRIDLVAERNWFKGYLLKQGYLDDKDKYGLRVFVQPMNHYKLTTFEEQKPLLEMFFEQYLVKKYTGKTIFDVREELEASLSNSVLTHSKVATLLGVG